MRDSFERLLLSLKKNGIRDYDVIFTENRSSPVIYEQNELQELQESVDRGYGLRILRDGRLGFASTNRLTDVEAFLEDAISTARFGEPAPFEFPKPASLVGVDTYDDTGWKEIERVNLGREILEVLRRENRDLKVDIFLEFAREHTRLKNSEGVDLSHRKTYYHLGISGFVILETGFVFVYEELSGTRPLKDPMHLISGLQEKLNWAKRLAKVEKPYLPVVMSPLALPSLLLAIQMGLNGRNVAKGISPLSQKIGQKVFTESFSIFENPHRPYGWGSVPFDGEGVPTRPSFLIERGVLREYILDLYSAGKLQLDPNGHARRDYSSTPTPGIHNLEISGSDKALEGMLKEESVLLVEDVIGAGQSNLLRGDFSLNVGLGFIVKRGEVVGRVKDTMISGNVYDVLKRPVIRSIERRTFRHYTLPYMMLEGIRITAKER